MKKKKNYKILIGIIIGFVISITGVYAATSYIGAGTDLTYDNSSSGLSSTNAQDAIDELYNSACPDGYVCYMKKRSLALGDYISYTPSSTSYTTDTDYTGYTSTQTIDPSELTLWRVININDDGTVDIISENVSSVKVSFSGQTGYVNFVGYLNLLASQYESTYTSGSRYFGYSNQTEYIEDTDNMTWECSTGDSDCDTVESQGGGDTGYTTDYNLVKNALGSLKALDLSGNNPGYWIASRYYYYTSSSYVYLCGRNFSGSVVGSSNLYTLTSDTSFASSYALRPIVTLKSGLSYYGVGNETYPMEIVD